MGYALSAVRLGTGDDAEELRNLDASEMYVPRLSAKEVLVPYQGDEFIFHKRFLQDKTY